MPTPRAGADAAAKPLRSIKSRSVGKKERPPGGGRVFNVRNTLDLLSLSRWQATRLIGQPRGDIVLTATLLGAIRATRERYGLYRIGAGSCRQK